MSRPQIEEGYTRVANELLEALCNIDLSPYESRVFWTVARMTYGYNKRDDTIAGSQFVTRTELDRRNVQRTVKRLWRRNLIIVQRLSAQSVAYGIQKDYSRWLNQPASPKTHDSLRQQRRRSLDIPTDQPASIGASTCVNPVPKPASVETHSKDSKDNTKEIRGEKFDLDELLKQMEDANQRHFDAIGFDPNQPMPEEPEDDDEEP